MADWTTVIVAGITGAVGYAGARLQATVALRGIRGELERLKAQHAEDHLRNRQNTYHRYLDCLEQFESFGADRSPTNAEFEDWRRNFEFLHAGVELFGADEVVARTEDLRQALVGLTEAMENEAVTEAAEMGVDAGDDGESKIQDLHKAFYDARRDVLAAMRRDVRGGEA